MPAPFGGNLDQLAGGNISVLRPAAIPLSVAHRLSLAFPRNRLTGAFCRAMRAGGVTMGGRHSYSDDPMPDVLDYLTGAASPIECISRSGETDYILGILNPGPRERLNVGAR